MWDRQWICFSKVMSPLLAKIEQQTDTFFSIAMLRTPLFRPGLNINDSVALIGAIFNANLQIGSSIALAIVTAITANSSPDPTVFAGYRAAWWFIIAVAGFVAILAAVSLRGNLVPPNHATQESHTPPEKVDDQEASPAHSYEASR
jgi:p-aminobenzoyl-glutamate transporter AbgT